MANYKGIIKKILAYVKYYTSFRIVKRDGKWMQKPRYEEPFYDAMTFDINNTEKMVRISSSVMALQKLEVKKTFFLPDFGSNFKNFRKFGAMDGS